MQTLKKLPRSIHILVGLLAVALVGLLDRVTGSEVAFSVFYLIPVAQVTWFAGTFAGIALAVVSAGTGLLADLAAGHVYSHPAIPFWNAVVRLIFFLVFTLILSALRKARDREQEQAITDSLTGAANARRFYEVVQVEKSRALRYKHPITLVIVDVDDFRQINDRFGYPIGDALLRLVATTIQDNIRSIDIVGRLGGDEFSILLVESQPTQAQTVIARIKESLAEAVRRSGWPVTFSFGAITFFNPSGSVDEMIRMVDALMYTVKSEGKNAVKYEVYSD